MLVRMRRVAGSFPCMVDIATTLRVPGSPTRYALIGRPFTEWPITRLWITAGRVAVVDTAADPAVDTAADVVDAVAAGRVATTARTARTSGLRGVIRRSSARRGHACGAARGR
jgi:hypothetical protein